MNEVFSWVIEAGWQAAVISLAVGVILMVTAGRISPAWRYAMLLLVVARLLLPALPQAPVSVYRLVPATPAAAWEQARPSAPLPLWLETASMDSAVNTPTSEPFWNWRRIAGWAWLTGSLLLAAWLTVCQLLFLIHLRRCRRHPSNSVKILLKEAADLAGMRQSPQLHVVEGLSAPALTGLFRPIILLPPDIEERLDESSLKFVLLHECIHLRRGDLWTHACAMAAAILHWWNPVVWWLMGRLHTERELATDAGVLARLTRADRHTYGEALLELAGGGAFLGILRPSLGVVEGLAGLRQRIRQIAGFGRTSLVGAVAGIFIISILAATLLVREPSLPLEPIPGDTQDKEEIVRDFMERVRQGDIAAVGRYLDRGLDVNVTNHYDNALFWAVSKQNIAMVKFLLKQGAKVNDKTSSGDTPVNRACWLGDKAIADILIAAGAICDPLIYDAGMGDDAALEKREAQKPLTEKELRKVAEFSCAANQQRTFDWAWERLSKSQDEPQRQKLLTSYLMTSSAWGRLAMMKHVIALGADIKKSGRDALARAVMRNRLPEAKYLMDLGISPSARPGDFRGFLGDAAGEGYVEMAAALLDHGAGINEQEENGMTALSWAAYCRHDAVCKLLVKRGADISIKDKQGQTALWYASFGGNSPEIVDLLLQSGADPGGVDANGSPILCAMQRFMPPRVGKTGFPGKIYTEKEKRKQEARTRRVTELLVKGGADPNAADKFDGSPLVSAITGGHSEIARVLIELGADTNGKDALGNTPLALVFEGGWGEGPDLDIIRLLLDRGADPNTAFIQPNVTPVPPPVSLLEHALGRVGIQQDNSGLQQRTREAIALLLARGAKYPASGDPRGSEWLAAAARGNLPSLRRLFGEGVDINTATPSGWNALAIALALGLPEEVTWLIDQGIALDSQASGFSPLYFAAQAANHSLVKRILASGAKPSPQTMSAAASTGNAELFEMLRAAGGDASNVPIWLLVRKGYAETLRIALENGANINPNTFPENRNAVYWAVYYNQPECLKLLLDHGAAPNMKDAYGQSPLEYAKKFRPALVPLLEEAIKNGETEPSKTAS